MGSYSCETHTRNCISTRSVLSIPQAALAIGQRSEVQLEAGSCQSGRRQVVFVLVPPVQVSDTPAATSVWLLTQVESEEVHGKMTEEGPEMEERS